jgi:putative heme-binding domain-containing protein
VAAIFALKQLEGAASHPALLELSHDPAVREFALRALTDRRDQLEGLDSQPFIAALADRSPRVRAQALISLGRLNDLSIAKHIIPLTARRLAASLPPLAKGGQGVSDGQPPIPSLGTGPPQNQPDPDRIIPHLAVRSLVALGAADACLEALDGPYWQGALWAMRSMHNPIAVEGLIKKLASIRTPELRRGILATLIRLYHREAEYTGTWWGIRPDSTGPYYDRAQWELSPRIGTVITAALLDGDPDTMSFLEAELYRHRVSLAGLPSRRETASREKEKPIILPAADPKNPNQIGNLAFDAALERALAAAGDATKGEALFKAQSCISCHTTADGQMPKGPHLVDIGKRYKPEELVESILTPSAKIAQGYESYTFATSDGGVFTGFIVSEGADAILLREPNSVQRELKRSEIEERAQQKQSAMPEGLVANLTPAQLADLLAYLESLK